MLVLTRHEGQKIIIGSGPDKITIMVRAPAKGIVKVGIEAPPHISVWREELFREGIKSGAAAS